MAQFRNVFRNIVFLVLLKFCPLFAVEISQELLHYQELAYQDKHLNEYLNQFPFGKYEIYEVPELGSFYIDDIPDGIKSHLKQGIYWEGGIAEYVKKYSKPNTIVVDLGAHIGIHTIAMSRAVGPQGLVVSFEPQFKIFREQFYNLRLNGCEKNVIQLPFAVGARERTIQMAIANPQNEGGTAIGKGGNKTLMLRLDSLDLSNVSFIKMDVESYEFEVLKGARNTLMRNKPILVFEILGEKDLENPTKEVKEKYDQIIQFLLDLDYQVEKIFGNDFIATPKSN